MVSHLHLSALLPQRWGWWAGECSSPGDHSASSATHCSQFSPAPGPPELSTAVSEWQSVPRRREESLEICCMFLSKVSDLHTAVLSSITCFPLLQPPTFLRACMVESTTCSPTGHSPKCTSALLRFVYLMWVKPVGAAAAPWPWASSVQLVLLRARGEERSAAFCARILNALLNFSENLCLNVDSVILLGFGIYFKGLCGSWKWRDYCQCTKQMDSARFHPFGRREIMLLQ